MAASGADTSLRAAIWGGGEREGVKRGKRWGKEGCGRGGEGVGKEVLRGGNEVGRGGKEGKLEERGEIEGEMRVKRRIK